MSQVLCFLKRKTARRDGLLLLPNLIELLSGVAGDFEQGTPCTGDISLKLLPAQQLRGRVLRTRSTDATHRRHHGAS
jgi:hypothetical protein